MNKSRALGRVAIVGAGAVGCYYGARLALSGVDVSFLMRSDLETVKRNGLSISSVSGDGYLKDVKCFRTTEEIGEVDWVILAWKTTSNHKALGVLSPLIGRRTKILTLQNGLGNCELLAQLFSANEVFGGLCFVCINRLAPGVISHTASGLVRVGNVNEKPSAELDCFADVANQSGFPCEVVESLEAAQWAKLIWNIPFNGLAIAEGGVDTSVILNQKELEPLVRQLMNEVASISESFGYPVRNSFIDKQIALTYEMGAYRPSSMIDFNEGREVEYESIWGEPLKRAKSQGLEVPQMERLASRIRGKLGLI